MTPSPVILTPPETPVRATLTARLVAAAVAAVCLAVLATAASLEPDPSGVGRTERLGLRPCAFLERTGVPCAGCGMTTSFSHVVRWQFHDALWVQPLGALLALSLVPTFWSAAYVAGTGRPFHRLVWRGLGPRTVYVVVGVFAFGLLAWGWKVVAFTLLS